MDSLTQIVLGGAVGEFVLGKKVGNKAVLWGAVGGTIPDLDVLFGYLTDDVHALYLHRGPSHSILFSILFAPLLGWVISKIHSKANATWKNWAWLSFWALFTHPILDCFTTWGTQLLWPFTDYAIAWKTIFVIDPLYTLPFMVLLILAMLQKRNSSMRRKLNAAGLIISSVYLCFTVVNKFRANAAFEASFATSEMEVSRYATRPAPLNTILWACNAEVEGGYYTGYYSLFDTQPIAWQYTKGAHELLEPLSKDPNVQLLLHITKDWYAVEKKENGYLINDLRFGKIRGWDPNHSIFVFAYEINFREEDKLEIKQKRAGFKEDQQELLGLIWDRMWGN